MRFARRPTVCPAGDIGAAEERIRRAERLLVERLLPHERAEEHGLLPAVAPIVGGATGTAVTAAGGLVGAHGAPCDHFVVMPGCRAPTDSPRWSRPPSRCTAQGSGKALRARWTDSSVRSTGSAVASWTNPPPARHSISDADAAVVAGMACDTDAWSEAVRVSTEGMPDESLSAALAALPGWDRRHLRPGRVTAVVA